MPIIYEKTKRNIVAYLKTKRGLFYELYRLILSELQIISQKMQTKPYFLVFSQLSFFLF